MTGHLDPNELGGFERRLLTALTRIDAQRQPAPHQAPVPTPQPRQDPRRPRRRRAVLGAAVLAGLFALTTTAVATLYNPADLDVGGPAVPGGVAVVKGAGCQKGSTVTFTLDDKIGLGATMAYDAEGLFFAELRIPAATPLGRHQLTGVCTGGDGKRLVQQAKLPIVKSQPQPQPPRGPVFAVGGAAVPGGVAAVKGSGCQEGSTVTFRLDGKTRLGVTKAGTDGWFVDAELRIPAATPLGTHQLTAVCTGGDGKRLVQQAKLLIVKTEPLPAPVAKSKPPPKPGGQIEPPPEPAPKR
jgi:hypothetical protein